MIESKDRQSLLDIVLIAAGTMEAAIVIATANGMAVTDDLVDRQEIAVPTGLWQEDGMTDRNVTEAFEVSGELPATAMTAEDEELLPGGIGYMAVGVDFVVS